MKKNRKTMLCCGLAAAISLFAACSRPADTLPAAARVTDAEILSALNGYEAGTFGWRRYYNNLLNDFVNASSVKLYTVDEGIGEQLFCAYLREDAYEAADVSRQTDRIYYLPGEQYVDGKHIGCYDGDAAAATVWYRIDAVEDIPSEIVFGGKEYVLDLVMAEKTYTYLYDCSAGVPMESRASRFVRYPLEKTENGLVLSSQCDAAEDLGDNSHANDRIFLEQAGEYVTQCEISNGYAPVSAAVTDTRLFAVREIDGERYMEFPPCENMTKAQVLSFCCDAENTLESRYDEAFLSEDGTALFALAVLFPPAA